jgi:hypothetical protein
MKRVKTLSAFALPVASEVESETRKSVIDKVGDEVLLPAPSTMPSAMDE